MHHIHVSASIYPSDAQIIAVEFAVIGFRDFESSGRVHSNLIIITEGSNVQEKFSPPEKVVDYFVRAPLRKRCEQGLRLSLPDCMRFIDHRDREEELFAKKQFDIPAYDVSSTTSVSLGCTLKIRDSKNWNPKRTFFPREKT